MDMLINQNAYLYTSDLMPTNIISVTYMRQNIPQIVAIHDLDMRYTLTGCTVFNVRTYVCKRLDSRL